MTSDILFSAAPEVVDCDIGGDRALLHVEHNTYFTVNPTAATLWMALSEPRSLDDLVGVITEAFEVSDAQCRPDIAALLEQMAEADIVKKIPAAGSE